MSDQTVQRPTIISRKWLGDHGACREQLRLFARVWPDGVAVTRETLEQFAKKGLPLEWLAEQVLPRPDSAAYQSQRAALYAAYQAQLDTQEAAYFALIRTLDAAYIAQRDTMEAAYQEQLAPQYAAYQEQLRTQEAAYIAQRDTLDADYFAQIDPLEAAYRAQRDTLLINAVCDLYESDAPALPSSSTTEAGNE